MASLGEKLAGLLVEVQNSRTALDKEIEERRRDHDQIIELRGHVKNLYKKVEVIEKGKTEGKARRWQFWLAIICAIVGSVVGAAVSALIIGGTNAV